MCAVQTYNMLGERFVDTDEGASAWVKPVDVLYTRHDSFSAGDNRERKSDAWKNGKSRRPADTAIDLPGSEPGAERIPCGSRPGARAAEFCSEPGQGNQCGGSGLSQEARRLRKLGHADGDRRFLFEWHEVGAGRLSYGGPCAVWERSGDRAGLAPAAASLQGRQSVRPSSGRCDRPEMWLRRVLRRTGRDPAREINRLRAVG